MLQDTVQILRGLSEKYSSYHGVRIHDRALVMSAVLADRYITARFLPDKAIDVVDEACSNLRVQLESMPEQLDAMLRQQYRLQVEEASLAKEKDPVSCRAKPGVPHICSVRPSTEGCEGGSHLCWKGLDEASEHPLLQCYLCMCDERQEPSSRGAIVRF